MIGALIQLIINPRKAWQDLTNDPVRQQYLPWLHVYPLLIITALSAYVHYWYGFTDLANATQEALITLIKYTACIISAFLLMVKFGRKQFAGKYSKSQAYLFVVYTYTITLLSTLINNLLPSDFTFVQFIPVYTTWIVYQGRDFLKIPQENVFNYTVIASVMILGLPFAWNRIFDIIIH